MKKPKNQQETEMPEYFKSIRDKAVKDLQHAYAVASKQIEQYKEMQNNLSFGEIDITPAPDINLLILEELRKINSEVDSQIEIFLTRKNSLHRGSESILCWEECNKNYAKMLRYLFEYNKYIPTKDLWSEMTEYKNEKSLQQAIGKYNRQASEKLKLSDNIIQGKTGSGYRINPRYALSLID